MRILALTMMTQTVIYTEGSLRGMNFLITAGGTVERIDSVRYITNYATGRLGSLTAGCLAESPETERIFYICGKTSARPAAGKAEILPVEDAAELEAAVRKVLADNRVDAVIHSMAVSDYRVKTLTTPRLLAEALLCPRADSPPEAEPEPEAGAFCRPETLARRIAEAAQRGGLERNQKICSGEENLMLLLEPTVKIISLFHELAPRSLLVGFKLLSGVSHARLIDTAYGLLQKNHCEYVLANDAKDIRGDTHLGYLIDRNKNVRGYENKSAIARGIAEHLLAKLKGKAG
jgi:phosphopantothenate-cysteine ligase